MLADFKLKVFMAVASERSFTKAASVLGISQPAVSQNIAELEKNLGTRLFDRLRSEVVLTREGRSFKPYAESIIAGAEEAETFFSSLPSSVIRVCASEEVYNYFLGPVLQEFSSIHPATVFERSIFDDCDLSVSLRPVTGSPFDEDPSVLSRIRVSTCLPDTKTGGHKTACEITSYFELLYQPSVSFSLTATCRILRQFCRTWLSDFVKPSEK